jgi:pimeloyl-ACP methyl ester carboxylesterase
MISAGSPDFEYIDRGRKETIALVPGWASDRMIFESIDMDFNYLVPLNFSPFHFTEDLSRAVKAAGIGKISLFGWSMGGFAAAEFAAKHKDLVGELILVSVRKQYSAEELAGIKASLEASRKGYLYKFYKSSMPDKDEFGRFKRRFLKYYCRTLTLDYLLGTLDYFKSAVISPEPLRDIKKVTIMHGEEDRIAPMEEAREIKDNLPHAAFCPIENAGHMPFLRENFNACLLSARK